MRIQDTIRLPPALSDAKTTALMALQQDSSAGSSAALDAAESGQGISPDLDLGRQMRIVVLFVGLSTHNSTHGSAALLTCFFRLHQALAAAVCRRLEREARNDAAGHDLHAAHPSAMHHEDCESISSVKVML